MQSLESFLTCQGQQVLFLLELGLQYLLHCPPKKPGSNRCVKLMRLFFHFPFFYMFFNEHSIFFLKEKAVCSFITMNFH